MELTETQQPILNKTYSSINQPTTHKFAFDKSFQEKIVQAMINDRNWSSQIFEVLKIEYFEYNYLKVIAEQYAQYHAKYKEFPSLELLTTIVIKDLSNKNDVALRNQVQEFIIKLVKNENLSDLGYVKEKALEFCKKQGLQNALESCVELIVHEDYDKVSSVIKDALVAGSVITPGLVIGDECDIDARYSETYRKTVPTGLPELDKREILNGGLGGGEIGAIISMSGGGKSHCLVHMAANAIKQGKNVVFYTFELNERVLGIRVDSHLVDISSTHCFEHKEEIKEHYKSNSSNYGKLFIKYYPTGTCTVQMLRNHIERLSNTGFKPDMIVIDYAGIMRSSEKYDAPRFELKKVFEELRGFAGEIDVPIWTAVQSNKEGKDAEVIDMTNMAESYGQAHICDFIVGLSRKQTEKSSGLGTLFISKNRNGIDGIAFKIHLDTAKSQLRVLTHEEQNLFTTETNKHGVTEDQMVNLRNIYKKMQTSKDKESLPKSNEVTLEKVV